jgi:hypothetical protein
MTRRATPLIGGVLASSLLFLSGPAGAEPPFFATCGRIDALTVPAAPAAGSITIGGQVVALSARDRIPSVPLVGTLGCLNQTVTTSGPALVLLGMPSHVCGFAFVLDAIPGISPARIDISAGPNLRMILLAAPGLEPPGPQAALACFATGIDSAGRATAVRTLTSAPLPAPAVTTLPSTSTPRESEMPSLPGVALVLAGAVLLLSYRLNVRAGVST